MIGRRSWRERRSGVTDTSLSSDDDDRQEILEMEPLSQTVRSRSPAILGRPNPPLPRILNPPYDVY
jgi:hypothetical protein